MIAKIITLLAFGIDTFMIGSVPYMYDNLSKKKRWIPRLLWFTLACFEFYTIITKW